MKRNKLLIYLCMFLLVGTLVPIGVRGASNDVIVESYTTSKLPITEGTTFNLNIVLKNISSSDVNNGTLSIDTGDFVLMNTGSVMAIDHIGANDTKTITLPLKWVGPNNAISLTLNWDDKQAVNHITLDTSKPSTQNQPTNQTPTNTTKYDPNLRIKNQEMPTVKTGKQLQLDLELENETSYYAKDISMELIPPADGLSYKSMDMSMIQYIQEIKGKKSEKLTYNLLVLSQSKAKTYTFQVRLQYKNPYGDIINKTQDIHVRVEKGIPDIKLGLNTVKSMPEDIYPGQEASLSFLVNNNGGTSYVKHIEVTLKGLSTESFAIARGVNTQVINNLSPGSNGEMVTFQIITNEGMKPGYYPLTVQLTYEDNQNIQQSVTKEIYLTVKEQKEALLDIKEISTIPSSLNAGEEGTLQFSVASLETETIEDIQISLKGLSPTGLNLVKGINSQEIDKLTPDLPSQVITFDIYASSQLAEGSYPLTIETTYKDAQGITRKLQREVYLQVGKQNMNLQIEAISAPSHVGQDQAFTIGFNLVNQSTSDAEDLTVTVTPADHIVPVSQNVKHVEELGPGKATNLSFQFQPTPEATARNYMLHIEIKDGKGYVINQYVGVYVDKDNGLGKPNIIVDSYKTIPIIVNAGQNFQLHVSLNNTHSSKSVQNIKVYLTAQEETGTNDTSKTGSVFTPVNSSNTFFVDAINPKEQVTKELTLYTIPYASAKTHTIQVNMEYEDEKGTPYTATELISVPVIQKSSFITSDIVLPDDMVVEVPHSLNLEISNTGKTTLDNFTVLVEGFGASNTRGYIGNITSGSTTYHKINVWPLEEGEITGAIVFTYTKPNGEVEEVRKDITTSATGNAVMTSAMGDMEDITMNQSPSSSSGIMGMMSLLGIPLAAVIVIIIIVVRKKKKKEQADYE